jgi:hypothetical protein
MKNEENRDEDENEDDKTTMIFSAPGLTDRSGGGSNASHDAAPDTGRKPAPALTLAANEEGRIQNEEVRCRTGNGQMTND